MALPQGALEQLLSPDGGTTAFDAAIQTDRDATEAALKREPAVAQNAYNQSQQKPAPTQSSTHEMRAIREAHILRGLRENPGRTRREIEQAFDPQVAERKSQAATKDAATSPPPAGMFDLSDMPMSDLVAMAGIDVGPIPSQYTVSDEHMAQFATYVIEQGIDARTASACASWLMDKVVEGGGEGDLVVLEKEFNEKFKGSKLSDAQRSLLVRWYKETVLGSGGEEV